MAMDDDLDTVFAAIRAEDARAAPPFGHVARPGTARRPAQERWTPGLRLAAVAAAAALVLVLVMPDRDRQPEEPGPALDLAVSGSWRAPSDFLLATPGSELLSELPTLGRIPTSVPHREGEIR
jgi:hypothetical protein